MIKCSFGSAIAVLLILPFSTEAQSTGQLSINPGSQGYKYLGCYNETLDITNDRAIYNGNVTRSEDMTVDECLDICKSTATGSGNGYKYAGLEYTSECWCGTYLSELSEKVNDSQCSLPCKGKDSEACGGPLKVSVYELTSKASISSPMSYAIMLGMLATAAYLL